MIKPGLPIFSCSWLSLLMVANTIKGFNIDTGSGVVHQGPSESCDQDCMFGFSVAQHKEGSESWLLVGAPQADTRQPGVTKGGAVYKCSPSTPGDCTVIPFDTQGNTVTSGKQFDEKSGQWLGSLVTTSGEDGTILSCAPRYVWFSRNGKRREPVGTCFTARNRFTNIEEISPCRTRAWGYHRQGSGQAGLGASVAENGEQVFIGAVGSWYWQGQVFSHNISSNISEYLSISHYPRACEPYMCTREGPSENDDSYAGYSITTGEFTGDGDRMDVAVGEPRGANLTGKVIIYNSNLNNLQNLTGDQIGAYFGYSVSSCDVNGDGLDDLLIGSPMWTDFSVPNKFETGRVYVAYQDTMHRFSKWDTLNGEQHKARFGLSVASLGNINLDGITPSTPRGYQDFAVGAPYEGPDSRGAVYIFLGSREGVIRKPSQIIHASHLSNPGIRTFGWSLSGGMDMDSNGYSDLLVGAYSSGHAVHLMAAPVINIMATLNFHTESKQIDLTDRQCEMSDSSMVPCVQVSVSLRYTGLGVPDDLDISLEYLLDVRKETQKRMFLLPLQGTGERQTNWNKTISMHKDQEFNETFMVYLQGSNIRDKHTSLDIHLRYSLSNTTSLPGYLIPVLGHGEHRVMDSLAIMNNTGEERGASNPCVSKESCTECLKIPSCTWCLQPDYLSDDNSSLPRCNQADVFQNAQSEFAARNVINPENTYRIVKNEYFRTFSYFQDAVQMMPQQTTLKLRVNEPFNMDFYYEQAPEYPVDLYYLMDYSASMRDDKEKLSVLGDQLAESMQSLLYSKIGFGSFMDKPVMPYTSTVPRKLEEPCDGCAAPYEYKHHMSLSTNFTDFTEAVKKAQISGNLDAPEGGLDAIMQAIVCKDAIGWRDKARRLIVFATDAGFHIAGDGKLGGIVTPNDGECHMDSNGMYTMSHLQDYPSVGQINHIVKENNVNLIFAVNDIYDNVYNIYNKLAEVVEGSSFVKNTVDSSNIVELVQTQYEAITSTIQMKDNSTDSVRVTYYSSCNSGGPPVETNKCSGLKVGTRVTFTAKIEVLECSEDPKDWNQTFHIHPVGIQESVIVNLEMICNCDIQCNARIVGR